MATGEAENVACDLTSVDKSQVNGQRASMQQTHRSSLADGGLP